MSFVRTDDDLDFVEIKIERGVVCAWHRRSATSIVEVRAVLEAIDDALSSSGSELLMIDSRDADRTLEAVETEIWDWVSGHRGIRKVATLMRSKRLSKKVRVTAIGNGVRLKTFADDEDARRWLLEA